MNIWLITIGEPILHPDNKLRLHRTGILAKMISENSDRKVTWWTSAFNHFTKKHMYESDTVVEVNKSLTMIALHGQGYGSNVSIARIKDHNEIARKFANRAESIERPDIIVAAFPTLGLCEAAVVFGKKHNIPVLVDYRDMWPEVFVDILPKKMQPLGRIALSRLFNKTRNLFANATGLIGITEEFLQLALKKTGRQFQHNDAVFPLGYLENQYTESELISANQFWDTQGLAKDLKTICFFGTLGYQFDLETVIRAASLPGGKSYQFVICGSGDKFEDFKKLNRDNKNVIFPGYMSAAQIKSLMNRSDYGLCPYMPKEAFLNSIPGKAIEYFSAGLPLLTTLGKGVLGEYVRRHQIGTNYEAFVPESLLESLDFLENEDHQSMHERIKSLFHEYFSANTVYSNYLNHLESVVSRFN